MNAGRSADRIALSLLVGHVALIAFSTAAMLTILDGPPAPFLTREPNATIMRLGWTYSGPLYVVLGALAALAHAAGRLGLRAALALFVAATGMSLAAELVGTSTGFPFGEYRYTPLLGYRVAGLVPFPIPVSWFYMLYACVAVCGHVLAARDDGRTRWRWALTAGAILVAWDVSMDPAMVSTTHWLWGDGARFRAMGLPEVVVGFFSNDFFYGMPLANWFGWFVTGTLIARVMLAIVPPTVIARTVSRSWLPLALYAVNGIMPVALCFRDGLWWAGILGAIAMALPLLIAVFAARSRGAERSSRTMAAA